MEFCNCSAITLSFNLVTTPLLLYLDGLAFCKCPELTQECENRINGITSYHQLVYDRVCLPEKFEEMCLFRNNTISDQRRRECDQILQYERGSGYSDWIIGFSPFCATYAYGASRHAYDDNPSIASAFSNMPTTCRHLSLFAIAIFYLLCLAIIIANVTVLLVVRLDQYFHTPYGYFKASIAAADLLVGLLVVPCLIYQLHELTFQPRVFRDPGSRPEPFDKAQQWFLILIGFFTVTTLSVSVYCLTASSLDRYFSIARPFRYEAKQLFTKKRSLVFIFFIWILSAIFALIPIMTSSTTYAIVSATFVLATDKANNAKSLPTFPWDKLFNVTSLADSQSADLRSFVTDSTYNAATLETDLNNETTVVASPTRVRTSRDSGGFYLLIVMYIFVLFLPQVLVWTINICTIFAFKRKNKERSERSESKKSNEERVSMATGGRNSSTSPCVSSATSIMSLQNADNSSNCDVTDNLERHVQGKLGLPQSGNHLAVPSMLRHFRHSLPAIATRAPPTINAGNRPNSARQSFAFPPETTRRASSAKRRKEGSEELTSRMSRILLRMVIAFTICIFPAICSLILHILFASYTDPFVARNYSSELKLFLNSFAYVASVFLFGNSFVNCIIYTVLGKRFREVVAKLYAGKVSSIRQKMRRVSIAFNNLSKKDQSKTPPPPKVVEHRV